MLLLELPSRRPMYGYELVRAIKVATGGELEFGEGGIYPILHRLETQNRLAASREKVGGRERVVYRVTPRGTAQLKSSVSTWQRIVGAVTLALHGGERGRQALA
jgi:PadR family transcriptional regulator PadR